MRRTKISQSFPLVGRRRVSSPQNPRYSLLKAVLEGRGIRKYGWAVIAGKKAVEEIALHHPERVGGWVFCHGMPIVRIPADYSGDVGCLVLDKKLFDTIDIWGTGGPLLVIRADPFPVWRDKDFPNGCTLFIPFQDPGNVGGLIRSAAAFGVNRVVLLSDAAHPFHPKSSRAASGTLCRIPFYQGPSIKELACRDVPLFTLDSGGDDLSVIEFPERFGLLPGQEGPGFPPHLRTLPSIRIPMEPHIESLNAATATAIVLYAWCRTRRTNDI